MAFSEVPMDKLSRLLLCLLGAGICFAALLGAFEYKLLKEARLHAPNKAAQTFGQMSPTENDAPSRWTPQATGG